MPLTRCLSRPFLSRSYALFELLHLDAVGNPAKPLARPRKKSTKTVYKSLAPDWGASGVAAWDQIDEALDSLGIKVDVWDADTFGSDPLGEVVLPLAALRTDDATPVDKWCVWKAKGRFELLEKFARLCS